MAHQTLVRYHPLSNSPQVDVSFLPTHDKRVMQRTTPLLLVLTCCWILPIDSACVRGQDDFGEDAARIDVPGFTAYSEPNPGRPRIAREAVQPWTDATDGIAWYGYLANPGALGIEVVTRLAAGQSCRYEMTVAPVGGEPFQPLAIDVSSGGGEEVARFGQLAIERSGYYRFYLRGIARSGPDYGQVKALALRGPAAEDAHFNREPRRNAASVHLWYASPRESQVRAFYNELKAETDPLWSYYMACGFHRGYFGIQVNSPTERRIIFSVWDSGNEGVDRDKVPAEDRVTLLKKGDGVVAHGFGNEGTGGHSHLVYPWKKGQTYRFLIVADPDEPNRSTTFTAYFFFPEKRQWGLIASFRAPKDGGYLRGLYSFSENFVGANGQELRRAEFGNSWVADPQGQWREITDVVFTHDATGNSNRQDYDAAVRKDRVILQQGGFFSAGRKKGDRLQRNPTGSPPTDVDSLLRSNP